MPLARDYVARVRGFNTNARWYLVYTFMSGVGFGIYGLFYNLYILSLGHSPAFLGLLLALPLVVVTVLAVPAGMLGRRIGYRNTLLLGTVVLTLSLIGACAAPSATGLITFALGLGVMQALLDVSNAPFVAENSRPSERTHLFSVQFAVRLFASFFGSLGAGLLPAQLARLLRVGAESPTAYQATLLLSAALFLLALLPLLRVRRPLAPRNEEEVPSRPIGRLSRAEIAVLTKLFVPQAVIGIGAGALVPFLNVFFKVRFGVSDSLLGVLFALQAIAMGLATLAGPAVAARLGRVRAVVLTQVLSIPFLAILGFVPFLPLASVGFLARAALMNMGSPLYSAFAMDQVDEKRRGTANALLVMSAQGSRALSSWAGGLLQQGPGFSPIYALTITCYLAASALTHRFFSRTTPAT